MTTPTPRTTQERIADYLTGGGLFNPELAIHDAVRDLLIDVRTQLDLLSSVEDGEGIVRELSGFTPGPWETNEAEHDCPYQDVVIRDTKGRGICRIWFDDAPVPDYNAEQSANARLIKAAPALLARITLDAQEKAALKGQADVLDALNTSQAHEIALLKAELASVKAEFRRECDDADKLLSRLGIEPEQYRSEGGSLLVAKIVDRIDNPPKHKWWGAGEADCPANLKAPNGELHTLQCKVCGTTNAERPCRAAHPKE